MALSFTIDASGDKKELQEKNSVQEDYERITHHTVHIYQLLQTLT